ncbi:MAG: hypothetical protein FJZ95_04590 [Chloroflexi bacterium]|nr:hypothetical protein [Chloroflexota bacterium]
MKNKRLLISRVLIGVTAIAVLGIALLTVLTMSKKGDKDDLSSQIAERSIVLRSLKSQSTSDQEQEPGQALAKIEEEQFFPVDLNSIDIVEIVYQFAKDCNVNILPIKLEPVKQKDLLGQSYNLVKFDTTVKGTFPDILQFIDKLENGPIKTASLQNTNLSVSSNTWTARLTVSIYSQLPPEEI